MGSNHVFIFHRDVCRPVTLTRVVFDEQFRRLRCFLRRVTITPLAGIRTQNSGLEGDNRKQFGPSNTGDRICTCTSLSGNLGLSQERLLFRHTRVCLYDWRAKGHCRCFSCCHYTTPLRLRGPDSNRHFQLMRSIINNKRPVIWSTENRTRGSTLGESRVSTTL